MLLLCETGTVCFGLSCTVRSVTADAWSYVLHKFHCTQDVVVYVLHRFHYTQVDLLVAVMPKKKPPVKTRRKQRPVVVRPQITSVSSPVNPPSFHSPKSSPVGIHLTPTTGTYPTSATGQYLPSVQQQPIPTSGQQLTVVSSDLTPPPDPSNLCPTLSSYGEWRTSELKRRSANKRSKELGTITGLEAANVSPVGNTGQMSPSSIAQAEVPTAAVPLQVAAPSDGAVILEGRPVNDQQAKEQIAIEAITQLSGIGSVICINAL